MVGWKLAAPNQGCGTSDNDDADVAGVSQDSIASELGILRTCGGEGACLEQQRAQHDVIGSLYLLMQGFDPLVAALVEGHVLAKRYLCTVEASYYDSLSPGSKRTLAFQVRTFVVVALKSLLMVRRVVA